MKEIGDMDSDDEDDRFSEEDRETTQPLRSTNSQESFGGLRADSSGSVLNQLTNLVQANLSLIQALQKTANVEPSIMETAMRNQRSNISSPQARRTKSQIHTQALLNLSEQKEEDSSEGEEGEVGLYSKKKNCVWNAHSVSLFIFF